MVTQDAHPVGVHSANQLSLTASLIESDALRYTPSGVPALSCRLEHESTVSEAGQSRQVKASVKAVSFGVVAERLAAQHLGSCWRFQGFVTSPKGTRQLVYHIQEFIGFSNH